MLRREFRQTLLWLQNCSGCASRSKARDRLRDIKMRLFRRASKSRIHSHVCSGLGRRSYGGIAAGCHAMSGDRAVCSLAGLAVGVGLASLSNFAVERLRRLEKLYDVEKRRYDRQLKQLRSCSLTTSLDTFDVSARRLLWRDQSGIAEAYHFPSASPLGVGSYGTVMLATHRRTGIERAVKRIDKQRFLPGEVEALKLMDHPHVCRLVEYFETERHLWLVMELCHGQELCDRVLTTQGLPEFEVARLLEQMLRATQHCHRKGRLHRDLKPENFLFTGSDELKLIDFGFSIQDGAQHSKDEAAAGTLLYMSPQLLSGCDAGQRDDVWSVGVIFHILLTGNFPFSTNDDDCFKDLMARRALQEDMQGRLTSLSCSARASDLVKQLLAWDANDRLSIEDALEHPFLAEWRASQEAMFLSAEDVYYRTASLADSCRLRKVILAAVAHVVGELRKDGEVARATYLELERIGGGTVSFEALDSFLRRLGVEPSPIWLSKVRHCLATDEGISYTGFLAATLDESILQDDGRVCRFVFALLDADRDGLISAQDLQSALGWSMKEAYLTIHEAVKVLGESEECIAGLSFQNFLQLARGKPAQVASGAARFEEASLTAAEGQKRDAQCHRTSLGCY
eukprot:s457_g6.t2